MSDAAALLDCAPLREILAILNGDGEEARVVGGAVRNILLGRPVHDYDIATTATPDLVTARALAAGLRVVPTGIAHGTVTLLVQGMRFEVTTLREDVETDGRHAVIRFGRDFAMDALRRDFTINALSLGLDGALHDYTGGRADIAAGRVRFIGDAVQRIREDFLRTLRFFRFSAWYAEGRLDPHGFSAAIRERAGLAGLSRERIRQELAKLLVAPRAAAVLGDMAGAGLLGPLLQGVPYIARLARLIAVAPGSDDMLRLAALAAATPEDAARLRDVLRLSNDEATRIARATVPLSRLHGIAHPPAPGDLKCLLFQAGRKSARDALALAHAESRAEPDDPAWRFAMRFLRDTPEPQSPFSGADLIARGFPAGKALGDTLKALQAAWIKAGFPQEPHVLATLLDEAGKRAKP